MNLYLLQRSDEVGYDEFKGVVVAAESEEKARLIFPRVDDWAHEPFRWDEEKQEWGFVSNSQWGDHNYEWANPKMLEVSLLAKNAEVGAAGVILASFKAG